MSTPKTTSSRRLTRLGALALGLSTAVGLALPADPADAAVAEPVTGRVSGQADFTDSDGLIPKVVTAGDGRFVAFTSTGSLVVPGLVGSKERVYVRDLLTDSLEVVSLSASGDSSSPSRVGAITPDGRFVAFTSTGQLVPSDTNGVADVYVRDRLLGTTEVVSVSSAGVVGNAASGGFERNAPIDISDDGRRVAFESLASNLIADDTNGFSDIFWRDRVSGETLRVSQWGSVQANRDSLDATMSADGMVVAFTTSASNLVPNDTNGVRDVVLRRMGPAGGTERVSVGLDANPDGASGYPAISADGTRVAFLSDAPDLVVADTNGQPDVFVRSLGGYATTTRASVSAGGAQLAWGANWPAISPDGTRVGFVTRDKLDAADVDNVTDAAVRVGSTTIRQSVHADTDGVPLGVDGPAVSDRTVAFRTRLRMADSDVGALDDVYVRRTPDLGPHTTIDGFVDHLRHRPAFGDATWGTATADAIRRGASPEHAVVASIDGSGFATQRARVVRLYWAYFRRRPDLGGLGYWMNQYTSGRKSLNRISLEFAKSSEFRTTYGNTTSTQFVTLVYRNVLEREPEPGGLAYWAGRIDRGTSAGQVMTSFSESSEGRRTMAPAVDTAIVGLAMLGDIPSQALFDTARDEQEAGQPREAIVAQVLASPQYAAGL